MSVENLQLFLEKLQEDTNLQNKMQQLNIKNDLDLQRDFIELGKEHGFEFNAEDLEQLVREKVPLQQGTELDETELEDVSGGVNYAVRVNRAVRNSFYALVIGCAVSAIQNEIERHSCGLEGWDRL